MQSPIDPVEISLHLSDGRVIVFKQPEGSHASPLLEGARLTEVFKRELLVLRGEQSVSLFPTDKVVRLDVNQLVSDWNLTEDHIQADQIADYDFQWLRETLAAVQKQFPERRRVEDLIVAADLEMANSEHLYLRVEFRTQDSARQPQDIFIEQILSSGGLTVRLREGGFSIINPKALVRLTLCPVPESVELSQSRFVG